MLARWGTRIRNYGLCVIYVARRQRNEEADKEEDTDDKEGTRGGGKRCTHKAAGSPGPRKPLEGSPGLWDVRRKSRKPVGPS